MTAPLNPAVEIKVLDTRLNDWGLPAYQSDMAAAIDLHACVDGPVSIAPGTSCAAVPGAMLTGPSTQACRSMAAAMSLW